MRIIVKIKPQEHRLDKYLLTQLKDLSRNQIRKHLEEKNILVNSHGVDPDYELHQGDKVDINLPTPLPTDLKAENIPLKIVYEDDDVIVVDKPFDLVIHPTTGHPGGTLVNGLLYHWQNLPERGQSLRPGIVHRLDKDTSGLIVVAKTQSSLENLKEQFKNHSVKKTYLALAGGHLSPKEGTIKAKIDRHPKNPMKFIVSAAGKEAITKYKVLEERGNFSLVELLPQTGRTHQLRVHLAAIGHPIVGDSLYGGKKIIPRQFLHAAGLEITSPTTSQRLIFEAPLPSDLQQALDRLT